jgi:hypothetical protein
MNATRLADDALPTEGSCSMEKFVHVKITPLTEEEKRAEVAKTAHLRVLRLVKEAADKVAASRKGAAVPPRGRARRLDHPS